MRCRDAARYEPNVCLQSTRVQPIATVRPDKFCSIFCVVFLPFQQVHCRDRTWCRCGPNRNHLVRVLRCRLLEYRFEYHSHEYCTNNHMIPTV